MGYTEQEQATRKHGISDVQCGGPRAEIWSSGGLFNCQGEGLCCDGPIGIKGMAKEGLSGMK